jgi:purine nucleosidase/pyrimidine-specific ribonucleoside hydrolase
MDAYSRIRVIIDTDPGVDDALAILLALSSPELDVVGITTVCGNVPVGQATKNLFRVLNLVQPPSQLLVGQGAARPLEHQLINATYFHGHDGLGELDRFHDGGTACRYPQPRLPASLLTAQEVWHECARRYHGDLVLITLGPLTNLALALKVSPELVRRFTRVICMGGAIAVPGNVSPGAEFNMYVDPYAAQRVFQAGLPLTIVPLDVTTQVGLNRAGLARLVDGSSDPVTRFIADATEKGCDYAESTEGHGDFYLHDPLAVAMVIDPGMVRLESLQVEVEAAGIVTRGLTVADRRVLQAQYRSPPNVQVAMGVDPVRAIELFQDRLCRR